jgi:hypothetical protein
MATHDPNHPYVRQHIGCGHGVLFKEPCKDCEIVGLLRQYKDATRMLMRLRNELRKRGVPLPGHTIVE